MLPNNPFLRPTSSQSKVITIHSDLRVTYLSVIFCTNSLVSFHHSIQILGGLSVEWGAAPAPAPVPLSATELDGPVPAATATGWDI